MKRIVFLTCIGSLALALTAWGAQKGKGGHESTKGGGARSAHVISPRSGGGHSVARANRAPGSSQLRTARARTHIAEPRTATRNSARTDSVRARSSRVVSREAKTAERTTTALNRERNLTRANAQRTSRVQATQARNARIAQATRNTARKNLAVNWQRNLTLSRSLLHNRAGNVRVTNNWRGAPFNDPRYAAFHNYNRTWHDRGWWREHHSHIVFVLGGWWYWNTGYWYPAWGYDPYGWYPYDGPIYTGYASLTPDQVIVNVQVALRDQGYYAGAIDGDIGPQTRAALAAFQSDNGLAVTSTVDEPTLQTLGVA
jgi:hypothetical protein